MTREIVSGVYWIYESGPDRREMFGATEDPPDWYHDGNEVYIPQCAYLFDGARESLLLDTLSPASTAEILDAIDECLDGGDLDYLVVSHPDVPHAGNTFAIKEAYPDVTIVAPKYGNDHKLYRLDDAMKVGQGDEIDLGDLVVEFHEATFLDAPVSVWMTEQTNEILCPVDWMGFPHLEEQVLTFLDEVEGGINADQLIQFHGRVLFWHQYVNPDKVNAEIDNIIAEHDPEIIAPTHGLVIREDAVEHMELMKDVVSAISNRERIGILG